MADQLRPEWIDGAPAIHALVRRDDAGEVTVRVIALHYGSYVWDRRVEIGKEPSHQMVRETMANLTADALIALEGQR